MHVRGTGEGDSSKVSKGDLGSVLVEILDDPLSIVLAEGAQGRLVAEGLGDGLPSCDVLENGGTGSLGARGHGDFDNIACSDGHLARALAGWDLSQCVSINWVQGMRKN